MSISRDEWLRALDDAGVVQTSDEQAITVRDFQDMFDLERYTAERRLKALVTSGKAIRTTKRTAARDGRIRYMLAYRLL